MTERYNSKTEYFSNLAVRNLSASRLLWQGDVLGKNREGHDIWRNVSEHCLVQAAGCEVVAQTLDLPKNSRKNLELAAIAHDWDKKYQMTGLRNIDTLVKNGEISENETGKKKIDFFEDSELHSEMGMKNKGISDSVILIASADGHVSLPYILNATLEEKIFHYVGSITDGSSISQLDQRIDNLQAKLAYKQMDEYGKNLAWTNGKTLYETQREIGHLIERELVDLLITSGNLSIEWAERLGKNPKDLPLYISSQIESKYQ